jgi:4-amino-4-deoxy-L-arabinose transferase-like glycosyltransferase
VDIQEAALTLRFWLTLLGVALLARLVFSFGLIADWALVSDGSAYSDQAIRLMAPGPDTQEYYWPPGTSYVLQAAYEVFGVSRHVARLTMIAVSLGSVVATVLLARRVLADDRAARIAGWVLALVPSAVFMPSQPFSFDLTMLGVTLCVLCALVAVDRGQGRWLALSGLAIGVAAAARPGSYSVLLALVPAAVLVAVRLWRAGERRRLGFLAAGALAFAVLAAAPVVPAIVHNHDVGAGATISTNNEGNLLYGNNPFTRDYKTWHQGQHDPAEFPADERAYLEEHWQAGGPPEERRKMRDEALEYMRDNPARTAWRTTNRVRAFWGFDYTYANGLRSYTDAPTPVVGAAGLLEVGGWGVLMALVLAGLVLGRRLFRPSRLLFLLAVVTAYQAPHWIAFSAGRWHLPVLALLAPLAAAGIVALGSPRQALGRVLGSRALLAALAVFVLLQVEYAYFVLVAAS